MNISGIGFHTHNGVKLTVHLHPTSTAIGIVEATDKYAWAPATIFLPVADYDRATRACAAFNLIMSEPGAEQPEETR